MNKQFLSAGVSAIVVLLLLPMTAMGGEKEEELIAKITAAYGGDVLLDIENYQISDHFLAPTTGQGHSPDLDEIGTTTQVLTVDVKNNKAVFDNWFSGRGGGFQGSTVSDGEKAHTVNYQTNTYGEAANADPHVFAGGTMRTSDTVLVYELNKVKEEAKLGDDVDYMSRKHHTLTMPFPSSPELKLFVDAQTNLVSKMQRMNPQLGALDYVYSNYKKNNGITYASSINFFIAGVPNIISTQHELSFNNNIAAGSFEIPEGFSKEAERIDTSSMLVNKISDRVYHIGQGNAYSIFIDTSMGIVSAGGYPGIKARLERFQEESNNYKPLSYQVVTHHHSDHIGGISEAIALGARLVTVDENVQTIKDGITPTPDDRDFYKVGARTSFGDGRNRVDVYEVSTIHAKSFLVTYVPADRVVFIADHMGSPFVSGAPVANQGTVDMLAALDALDIDVRKIATAHNARIFNIADMRASVAAFKPSRCAGNRPVCQ